ncbi:ATPase [Thermococcus sp. M36]|uniref:RAD55 family ATPase n=1 Tax=Thermococcus sp. M36 TaxID=1638261 RepID=UPI001439E551|nr:ATPase domain-containing protein [Thermococcus sp. M36]NJE05155.1 ATPase [Thermococcus sp. M36]
MERVSTGIPGLDKMLNGGLIPGRAYLIKGEPGMGKTTLSIQFLMEGVRRGENVMYITLEEPLEMVKKDMRLFGFDLDNPLFHGIDATPVGKRTHIFEAIYYEEFAESFEKFSRAVEERIRDSNIKRVAVDPITMLRLTTREELEYRRVFIEFLKVFMRYGVTVLITSNILHGDPEVEDYLTSGVIELKRYGVKGRTVRGVQILKMRGSSFDEDVRPYIFSEKGIEVYASESLYAR